MLTWLVCVTLVGSVLATDDAPKAPPAPPAVAPPTQVPPATVPATAPPTDTTPLAPSADTPPEAPVRPRRVWIFIDRYKETGGTIEVDDETTIVIKDRRGDFTTFSKGRLIAVVPLVEPAKGGTDGLIHLRDGTALRAIIHDDGYDFVDYEIAGIRNRMPRESVAQVTLELSFEEKYVRFREAIKPNEVDKRLTFAQWLTDEKRFDLAAEELRALTREVDLPEARELLRMVEAQLAMEAATADRKGDRETPGGSGTGSDTEGRVGDSTPPGSRSAPESGRSLRVDLRDVLPSRILSPDDVNLIRVYEVDLNKPPRIDVPPEVIRDLLTQYGSSSLVPAGSEERNRMFSWEPSRLLRLLFDLKARDLYTRVRITSEPWALNIFRTKVHDSWMIPNCATSQCHGGIDAGRFFLHRRNSKDERVRYTNLLILMRLRLDHSLIDFEDPESSLIVQYAMPRDEARYPHPEVKGWKPIFAGSARSLKAETLRWIRAMYKPRPDYPVDYEPPQLDAIDRSAVEGEPVER